MVIAVGLLAGVGVLAVADGEGDLTARLPEQAPDETGEVARAVNKFIARVQEVIRQMAGAAHTLDGSVQTLSAMTSQMSANADETSNQAVTVTRAADDVSRNVSTLPAELGHLVGSRAATGLAC